MTFSLVIGVGNPFRHDDGAGLAVIERLRASAPAGVDLVEESGEPVALVQRWSGHRSVVLVDAVDSGGLPGTIHRFRCAEGEWDAVPPAAALSTHGLGLAEAVELGRVLDRLPEQIVFFGVEADDVTVGVGLSQSVALALDGLVDKIVDAATEAALPGPPAARPPEVGG